MAKVYLSSTFADLEKWRSAVAGILRKAAYEVVGMEDYAAADQRPLDKCLNDVSACDVYVGLFAWRYGYRPERDNPDRLSITECEFRHALHCGKSTLLFLLDESVDDWPDVWRDTGDDGERIASLRREISKDFLIDKFKSPDHLAGLVSAAVSRWKDEIQLNWLEQHIENLKQQFAARSEPDEKLSYEEASSRYIDQRARERVKGPLPDDSGEPLHKFVGQQARLLLFGDGGGGKTTALLKLTIDLGTKALADAALPLPVYAQLNRFDTTGNGLTRLVELIANTAGLDPDSFRRARLNSRRPFLFVLDGFNEVAQSCIDSCTTALHEFMEVSRHRYLISSRPGAAAEDLASPEQRIMTLELLPFSSDQIREFLSARGAAELIPLLHGEIAKLAQNPFILWALSRGNGEPHSANMPRCVGRVYQRLVEEYIFEKREGKKRPARTTYSFELVKRPVLASLAARMTERTETTVRLDGELSSELDEWITSAKAKAGKRRAGPPGEWIIDDLLDELVDNGILHRTGGVYEFMHPSIRDYFCAIALTGNPLGEVLSLVPEARWKTGELATVNEQQSRYYQALVMLSGLRNDSGELVLSVISKDPLLAAECYRSRNQESPEAEQALAHELLGGLGSENGDARRRAITGCRLAGLDHRLDIADALMQLSLGPSEGADSANAVLRLSEYPREESVVRLLRVMLDSPDPIARSAAAMSLPERGDEVLKAAMLHCALGSARADMAVEPALARAAFRLLEEQTPFDSLIETALSEGEKNDAGALLVLRLTNAEEAAGRFAAIAPERDRAITALPLLGDPALSSLISLLTNRELGDTVRAHSALGLAVLKAQRLLAPTVDHSDRIGPILRQHATDTGYPPLVRSGLIAALMQTSDDADLDFALELLADGSLDSAALTARIEGIWRDVQLSVPSWLISSFQVIAERTVSGDVPEKRILKVLRWLWKLGQSTTDEQVRRATHTAHREAPESARRILLAILSNESESGPARQEAALLLAPYPGMLLRAVLDLNEDDLRSYCADVLFILDEEQMIAWATSELLRPQQKLIVRERAAAALVSGRSRAAINALVNVIRSSDDRTAVGAALYALMRTAAGDSPTGVTMHPRVYTVAGDYDQALADYDEAIAANPTDVDLALGRAHLYCLRKQLDRAREEADRVARAAPGRADVLSVRAYVLCLLGQADESVVDYRQALEIDPKLTASRIGFIRALKASGREAETAEQIRITRASLDTEPAYNRACFEAVCGNLDAAVTLLAEALDNLETTRHAIADDPDLDTLRQHPDFQKLMSAGIEAQGQKSGAVLPSPIVARPPDALPD